jgi:hypothetical protein
MMTPLLAHIAGQSPVTVWLFKVFELGFTILPTLDKAATVKEDPVI